MPRKKRRQLKDFISEAKFFDLAESHLREAFPNPQRIGCPADSDLQRMAEHPVEARDVEVSEHLTCCSPCFKRYMGILASLRQKAG
jgi:hypothetical protein